MQWIKYLGNRLDSVFLSEKNKQLTSVSMLLLFCLLMVIVFDALQQQYYVERFSLLENPRPFGTFFKAHLLNWFVWFLVGIPLVVIMNKKGPEQQGYFHYFLKYFFLILLAIVVDALLMSIIFFANGHSFLNFQNFQESFLFFLHQKLPVYFMGYVGLIIIAKNYREMEQLTIRVQALKELSESNGLLYNELKASYEDTEKIISVRIGNKLKQVMIADIEWIESDNYCVKLHTKSGAFTIRSSMKYLEKFLPENQFLRVHRAAIVNLLAIDELNTAESPVLKLKSGLEIKVANSRIADVKKKIRSKVA